MDNIALNNHVFDVFEVNGVLSVGVEYIVADIDISRWVRRTSMTSLETIATVVMYVIAKYPDTVRAGANIDSMPVIALIVVNFRIDDDHACPAYVQAVFPLVVANLYIAEYVVVTAGSRLDVVEYGAFENTP